MSEELKLLRETSLLKTARRNLILYLPMSVVNLFELKPRDRAQIFYDRKENRLVLKFRKVKEKPSHAKKA